MDLTWGEHPIESFAAVGYLSAMNILLLIVVLLLLFGGGGLGLLLVICLLIYAMGGFRRKA